MPKFSNRLTRLGWGVIGLNTLLIFLVPTEIDSTVGLILLVFYFLWLVISTGLALTWEVFHYKVWFRNWWGLVIPLVIFNLTNLGIQKIITINSDQLTLFIQIAFLASFWVIGIALAIYLWYRDVGLGLIAWWLVAIIWVLVLAWRFQGNLIELWFTPLREPGTISPMGWFVPLQCVSCWVLPLGILSFISYTIRSLIKTLSDNPNYWS